MNTTLHNTQVDLDGLLQVLGKNLYSSPSVAIRELIQNAHDACHRRKIEDGGAHDFQIHLKTNEAKGELVIEDNGSGLTREEIVEYLATIGSGYTRVLRDQSGTDDMIGYFGLGFLSAYVVSDHVEVTTTSYKDTGQAWRFTSKSGKQFSVDEAKPGPVGSRIKLRLTDEFRALSDPEYLYDLVAKYCCLLPVPIFLNGSKTPVNNYLAPWGDNDDISPLQRKKKQLDFANLFEHEEPVCVIPIPEKEGLDVRGILWIQGASGYATSDYRNVNVFVRNMFITDEARDFLPPWAGFVGCVIESNALTPTASREDIQKNAVYADIQQHLTQSLIDSLQNIAKSEAETWRTILNRHNQALLAACVSDDRLFELTCESLKVPTTMGDLTIPALLKHGKGKIYLQYDKHSNHETILFRAKRIPIVKGYMFAVGAFCHRYQELGQADVLVLGTRSSNDRLFEPVEDEQVKSDLSALFIQDNEELICTRLDTEYIPLVIVDDQDVKLKERIENDEADQRISKAVLGLARIQTGKIDGNVKRRLYVNLASPLIQRLQNLSGDAAEALATTIRTFTFALAQQDGLEEQSFSQELQSFNASLLHLIKELK